VKHVRLEYGPSGQSRGTATIVFVRADAAAKAAAEHNGIKVDRKPMKVVDASNCARLSLIDPPG